MRRSVLRLNVKMTNDPPRDEDRKEMHRQCDGERHTDTSQVERPLLQCRLRRECLLQPIHRPPDQKINATYQPAYQADVVSQIGRDEQRGKRPALAFNLQKKGEIRVFHGARLPAQLRGRAKPS